MYFFPRQINSLKSILVIQNKKIEKMCVLCLKNMANYAILDM